MKVHPSSEFGRNMTGFLLIQDASERKIRFTSNYSAKELVERIEDIVIEMGFCVQKKNGMVCVLFYLVHSIVNCLTQNVEWYSIHRIIFK